MPSPYWQKVRVTKYFLHLLIGNSFGTGSRRRGPFANTDPAKLTRCKRSIILAYNILTSHLGLLLILIIHSFVGAAIFQAIESGTGRKSDIDRIKTHRLKVIEELATELIDAGLVASENYTHIEELIGASFEDHHHWLKDKYMLYLWPSAKEQWSFFSSMFYCATLYSTIGYGTIFPSTSLGRWISILYAIVGIPIFLITIADLGLLFTKILKAVLVWASKKKFCKKNNVDDKRILQRTFKRQESNRQITTTTETPITNLPPLKNGTTESPFTNKPPRKNSLATNGNGPPSPKQQNALHFINVTASSAKHDHLVVNDVVGEKLDETASQYVPLYIPVIITLLYALLCTGLLMIWEKSWDFSEAFYFVFITFTTIGLGDYVPHHQNYFLASFAVSLFGLALVAMVINVIIDMTNRVLGKAKTKVDQLAKKMSLSVIEEIPN